MGQKVHPVGFRVGITKPYQSQWFARFHKYQYSQTVLEDFIVRERLFKLFPKLLNSTLIKKKEDKVNLASRITHIKIERGLIPYQIGIQIHAENCDILKSSIDNLTVSTEISTKLQKLTHYLTLLQNEVSNYKTKHLINRNQSITFKESLILPTEQRFVRKKKMSFQGNDRYSISGSRKGKILDILKKNPKNIERYNKTDSRLKTRRVRTKYRILGLQRKNERYTVSTLKNFFFQSATLTSKKFIVSKKTKLTLLRSRFNKKRSSKNSRSSFAILAKKIRTLALNSSNQTAKKIFTIFLMKMQNNFFNHLKEQLQYWSEQSQGSLFGSNKQWNIKNSHSFRKTNFIDKLKTQSIYKLSKLVQRLEKKAFLKLERLRVDYIATGPLSKTQTFGYYQIIMFIKAVKDLILKQKTIGVSLIPNKTFKSNHFSSFVTKPKQQETVYSSENDSSSVFAITGVQTKLQNLKKEYTKIKFVEFLKETIHKHRQKNIYYYFSNIWQAKQNLREIQKFTKRHVSFLFNLDLTNEKLVSSKINETLKQSTPIQQVFFKQIEKQKKINQHNLAFFPKLSVKFYNAPTSIIATKAIIVAENVADALEKRQAFRKVIKQAMSETIKNPRVKGVKIQVAGRLNGAEIARTEWVRSGRVPLQTLTANIDYAYKTANTIYGIIGIKVWLFKGYVKTV